MATLQPAFAAEAEDPAAGVALAETAALLALDERDLPFTDDLPLPGGNKQSVHLRHAGTALPLHYRGRDVSVEGDMFVHFLSVDDAGQPTVETVAPDVFVAFGVLPRERDSYVVWQEGKPPDFVLEVASESTWRHDRDEKPALYARMGVGEYFLYDPSGKRLDPPLQGHALRGGKYRRLPTTRLADGRLAVFSPALGLYTCLTTAGELRWHDPQTGRDLPTLEEETAARQAAENRADAQAAARRAEATARQAAETARREEAAARQAAEAARREEAAARQDAEARADEAERQIAELQSLIRSGRKT